MAATTSAAAMVDYFYQRQTMPERQAESLKRNPTTRFLTTESEKMKNSAFTVTIKAHQRYSGSHGYLEGMSDEVTSDPFKWTISSPYPVMYARLTIEGLLLAQTPVGTLLDVKASEMDDQDDVLMERIEKKLWSDQYDDLGQRASLTSGSEGDGNTLVVRLVNPSDVYNFKVGMYLEAFSDRSTAATAKRASQDFKVTSIVDPVLGDIAVLQIGAGTNFADNDYLFVRGDRTGTGSVGGRSFPGITAFIPSSDPGSSDSFLGQNRYLQGPYMSGWRFQFKGTIKQTIKYSFMIMGRYVNRTKARFTVCLSAGDWYLLEEELEGEIIRNPNAMQLFGTESLQVRTMWGLVDCIAIPVLRDGRMYFMDWSSWTLHHLKAIPHVIDDDGKIFQRLAPTDPTGNTTAGDGIEARFRVWLHPVCHAPISNGTAPTA